MGSSIVLHILFAVLFTVVFTNAQQDKLFFRKDYTYLNDTQSFYKIHTLPATWQDAKKRCEWEGAVLFHPEDAAEANAVTAFWNQAVTFDRVHVGLNDLLVEGVFLTIDGKSLHDVHSNWRLGQPDNYGVGEHCVEMFTDGTFNDISCHLKHRYICKKALKYLKWNEECRLPRTDYTFIETLDRCYKFHSVPKNWTEAVSVCHAEQSYLAVINSDAEASFLVQLARRSSNDTTPGLSLRGQMLLGIHNRLGEGWQTITGEDLRTSGYSDWASNQPSGDGDCGAIAFRDHHAGYLNDLPCHHRGFFVCEHEVSRQSVSNDIMLDDYNSDFM